MAYKIQLRRGLKNDLPSLDNGEVAYTQDTNELYIGTAEGNRLLTFDTVEFLTEIDAGMFEETNTGIELDGGEF
jgi:hypothetical protein